jgi:hypothetical protein
MGGKGKQVVVWRGWRMCDEGRSFDKLRTDGWERWAAVHPFDQIATSPPARPEPVEGPHSTSPAQRTYLVILLTSQTITHTRNIAQPLIRRHRQRGNRSIRRETPSHGNRQRRARAVAMRPRTGPRSSSTIWPDVERQGRGRYAPASARAWFTRSAARCRLCPALVRGAGRGRQPRDGLLERLRAGRLRIPTPTGPSGFDVTTAPASPPTAVGGARTRRGRRSEVMTMTAINARI